MIRIAGLSESLDASDLKTEDIAPENSVCMKRGGVLTCCATRSCKPYSFPYIPGGQFREGKQGMGWLYGEIKYFY